MTNIIAFCLALVIGGFLAADYYWFQWELSVFLGRKLLELIEYIAFWR